MRWRHPEGHAKLSLLGNHWLRSWIPTETKGWRCCKVWHTKYCLGCVWFARTVQKKVCCRSFLPAWKLTQPYLVTQVSGFGAFSTVANWRPAQIETQQTTNTQVGGFSVRIYGRMRWIQSNQDTERLKIECPLQQDSRYVSFMYATFSDNNCGYAFFWCIIAQVFTFSMQEYQQNNSTSIVIWKCWDRTRCSESPIVSGNKLRQHGSCVSQKTCALAFKWCMYSNATCFTPCFVRTYRHPKYIIILPMRSPLYNQRVCGEHYFSCGMK